MSFTLAKKRNNNNYKSHKNWFTLDFSMTSLVALDSEPVAHAKSLEKTWRLSLSLSMSSSTTTRLEESGVLLFYINQFFFKFLDRLWPKRRYIFLTLRIRVTSLRLCFYVSAMRIILFSRLYIKKLVLILNELWHIQMINSCCLL